MLWNSVTFAKVNKAKSFVRLVAATQLYYSAVQGPLVICRYLPRQPENLESFTSAFDPHFLVNLYRRKAFLYVWHFVKCNANRVFSIIIKIIKRYKFIFTCLESLNQLLTQNRKCTQFNYKWEKLKNLFSHLFCCHYCKINCTWTKVRHNRLQI